MFCIFLYSLAPSSILKMDLMYLDPIQFAKIHAQLTLLQHACLCRSRQQVLCTFDPETTMWCNWHTGMRLVNPQYYQARRAAHRLHGILLLQLLCLHIWHNDRKRARDASLSGAMLMASEHS